MLALLAAAAFSAAANAQPGSLPAPGTYAITNGMKHNGSWGLTIGNGHCTAATSPSSRQNQRLPAT